MKSCNSTPARCMPAFQWSSILASLTRMYPFFSGRGLLANHRLMRVLLPASSENFVWTKSPGGEVQVSLKDHVGRSVFLFGDLDPKITWILKRLLKPGDRVLDIGANIGLLSLWMSKLVGPRGIVHAFEPNPVLCGILQSTLARNRSKNIKLHPIALGGSEGRMELHVPTGNFGAASLVRKAACSEQIHTVPVVRLDEIMFRESETRIALIKLDVEGFELEVLKGARRVLQEVRPSAILFESNEPSNRDEMPPVMRLLHECGYEFLAIPRCLIRMRTKLVNFGQPNTIIGHDFVAAPRGEAFAKACRQLRAG
jgi:FkbM family methyltransferase